MVFEAPTVVFGSGTMVFVSETVVWETKTTVSRPETILSLTGRMVYVSGKISGRLLLPFARAAELLGPDCLYHLYSVRAPEDPRAPKARPGSVRRKGARCSKTRS